MKVGDLIKHKTFGHTGLILQSDPRSLCSEMIPSYFLIVWSDWPRLPQEDNQTWALADDIEVINAASR